MNLILKWGSIYALRKYDRMVAAQHPLRIGRTQSPLKTSVPDVFAFLCSSMPKSTRFARNNIFHSFSIKQACFDSFYILFNAFGTSSHEKTRTVRAGFVTPSGFKPETF